MLTLYKLTDENDQTFGGTQWGEGVTHSGTGKGELCGPGWIHAYTDPLLAVLLNPIHANFKNPHLWRATTRCRKVKTDHGLKVGVKTLTTVKRLPLPRVTTEQRARFAVLCAKTVCDDPAWNTWAARWLSGEDRSRQAAMEAAGAATAWAAAAAGAATAWAAWAAWAAEAAEAWATEAWAAAWAVAAEARAAAAARAARAVEATARTAKKKPLNLIALARRAFNEH